MSATGSRGFTLIEMLVVLAILGLIGGLAFPRLQQASQMQAFRTAGSTLSAMLREARARALRTGTPIRVLGGAARPADIPPPMTVAAPPGGIVFYGDGSSTGGTAVLEAASGRLRYDIEPATGLFRITRR